MSEAETIDIESNRRSSKWTKAELVKRGMWEVCQPLFRFSPRVFWGWRRNLLRMFGARVGRSVHIHPTVSITVPWNLDVADFSAIGDSARVYNLGTITIGYGATVSQGAHLCAGTHDYTRADLPLIKANIRIGEGVWVCADAFVGPGVTVGKYAIVGARAVAVKDVPEWAIVAGNPAKVVGERPALSAARPA
jgi:putative colanic acid biosynthesis acetyltransferase WcaF